MNSRIRKKLIEVSIPLEAINKASAKEKAIRQGHPSSLHLWWARRPLAACRAVLFAQLVDDPSGWPDQFPTEMEQDAERKRLHKVIADLVPWEASNNDELLNAARWEIARSVAWGLGEEPPPPEDLSAVLTYLQTKAPPVYDPFSGGGSIPLEAQRLGLRAYGSDLNPVAVLIGKALVEIPPKFAGAPPVNPAAREEARNGTLRSWKGAQGLAEDVRFYGAWMREEAARRIGDLYPKVTLPDGSPGTVIAWLWARTVRSPDPAAKGAMVPLVSSFLLSAKDGKKSWAKPMLDVSEPHGYRFEVKSGPLGKADEERLRQGTKSAKGQAFVCIITGSAIDRSYIQAEGKSGRLGQRLMAIVAEGNRSRIYLNPTLEHETIARSVDGDPRVLDARASFLSGSTPTRAMITGGVCSAYGLQTWGHLFTPRQLIALTTLSDIVSEAQARCLADAESLIHHDTRRLSEGGQGPAAYADAVATYLAFAVDKLADLGNNLVRWEPVAQCPRQLFGRQGMAMIWDFAESNTFSSSSGGFKVLYDGQAQAMHAAMSWYYPNAIAGITSLDAAKNSYPVRPIVVSTDPPYYDNIGYAVLSDFFYVWLKRSLVSVWPELFRRLSTPKDNELVATPYRHGGQDQAEAFFMKGMGDAMSAMRKAAGRDEPLAIYYAFKQAESSIDGVTSAGWASFLQAVVDAGLSVDGTWPMRTENASRLVGQGHNALASSIVLVCRKLPQNAEVATRADFIRALKRGLPDAIEDIRKAGVGPVDMQQSVIGPGMGVFTRFARVLEDDDSTMGVRTALTLINRVWEEIENELDAAFDPVTQVALAWFATYGFEAKPSGELIMLANAKNIHLEALFSSGVFHDLHGRAGLIPRIELLSGWTPVNDKEPTVWECVQHTARVLAAADGGAEAAGALVGQMGRMAADARTLAYRLFEIATKKSWSAEALVYNELAEEWPHLEDLAPGTATQGGAVVQGDMFQELR